MNQMYGMYEISFLEKCSDMQNYNLDVCDYSVIRDRREATDKPKR